MTDKPDTELSVEDIERLRYEAQKQAEALCALEAQLYEHKREAHFDPLPDANWDVTLPVKHWDVIDRLLDSLPGEAATAIETLGERDEYTPEILAWAQGVADADASEPRKEGAVELTVPVERAPAGVDVKNLLKLIHAERSCRKRDFIKDLLSDAATAIETLGERDEARGDVGSFQWAADRVVAAESETGRLRAENERLRNLGKKFADAVERIGFDIRPPNAQTPRLELAVVQFRAALKGE